MNFLSSVLVFSFLSCVASTCLPNPIELSDLTPAVNLVYNPWDASRLNVEIAKILLEEVIGIPTNLFLDDEYSMFPKIESGEYHACLEIWPSGHNEDFKNYISVNKTIESAGPLGPIGQIGWFIPTVIADMFPFTAVSASFEDPANCAIFNYTFYQGDPNWFYGDQEIIDDYGYDFNITVTGSEQSLMDLLLAANASLTPVISYFWRPHGFQAVLDLTRVALPGEVENDIYPSDILRKVMWGGLSAYQPSAHYLITSMNYDTTVQQELLRSVLSGQSYNQTACDWVLNNSDVWSFWIIPQSDLPEYLRIESAGAIVMIAYTASIQIFLIICFFLVFIQRNNPFIKISTYIFVMISIFGALVMTSAQYWLLGISRIHNCAGAILFFGLGFTLMQAAIIVKEFRIYRIFLKARKLKFMKIEEWKLLPAVIGILIIEIIIDVLWLSVTTPSVTYANCKTYDGQFISLYIFIKVLSLVAVFLLCVLNYRIIPHYPELPALFLAEILFSIVGVVTLILIFQLSAVDAKILTMGFGTSTAVLAFFLAYFGVKTFQIVSGTEVMPNSSSTRGTNSTKSQNL